MPAERVTFEVEKCGVNQIRCRDLHFLAVSFSRNGTKCTPGSWVFGLPTCFTSALAPPKSSWRHLGLHRFVLNPLFSAKLSHHICINWTALLWMRWTEMGLQRNLQLRVLDATEHHRWTHLQRPVSVSRGRSTSPPGSVSYFWSLNHRRDVLILLFLPSFPGSSVTTPLPLWTWMTHWFSETCPNLSAWSTHEMHRMSEKSKLSYEPVRIFFCCKYDGSIMLQGIENWKFSHFLLTTMSNLVTFCNPCNPSGVSRRKRIPPKANPKEASGCHVLKHKKEQKKNNMLSPYCSCAVIRVPERHSSLSQNGDGIFTSASYQSAAFKWLVWQVSLHATGHINLLLTRRLQWIF